MQARYPNAGNPSPGEIFAAYKDLPQIPGGLERLQAIIQQNQGTGTMNGSIAASVLNAANQAKMAPPMPQGTVADQVVAQAQPPIDPNMMGIAAPGLEQYAQDQGMAVGGLVALAEGGSVQGYAEGGMPWYKYPASAWPSMAAEATGRGMETLSRGMQDAGMPDDWWITPVLHMSGYESPEKYYSTTEPSPSKRRELEAAGYDLTPPTAEEVDFEDQAEGKKDSGASIIPSILSTRDQSPWDLSADTRAEPAAYSPGIPSAGGAEPTVVVDTGDQGIPAAAREPEERTTGGTSAKVPHLTAEQQIAAFAKLYEGDHSKAAELKGQMEKRLASKENKDLITDIATGLGMMFSGQGTKTQAMGQGLMAFAAQHGKSGSEHDRLQAAIDAMGLQEEAQKNAAMQAAIKQVYGTQAEAAKQEQKHKHKLEEIGAEGKWREAYGYARAGEKAPKGALRDIDYANMQKDAEELAREDAGARWLSMSKEAKASAIKSHYDALIARIPGGGTPMSGAVAQAPVRQVMYRPPS